MKARRAPEVWFRDRAAWSLIGGRFLPSLALLNLLWETAQLPLYTIWHQAPAGYIAFAVVHCTVGDLMIGAGSLAITLVLTRAPALHDWRWFRVGALATLLGVAYTIFSEWMNVSIRSSWEYSALMPTLDAGGMAIALAPVAQWLLIPPLALYTARRMAR
jgi:hypothetical protein